MKFNISAALFMTLIACCSSVFSSTKGKECSLDNSSPSIPDLVKVNTENAKLTNLKIDHLEKSNDQILAITGLILAIAALIVGGSLFYSYSEHKKTREEIDRVVNDSKQKIKLLIEASKKDINIVISEGEVELDHFMRRLRLQPLLVGNNDVSQHSQSIYSDFEQLAERPTLQTASLAKQIIAKGGAFTSEDCVLIASRYLEEHYPDQS